MANQEDNRIYKYSLPQYSQDLFQVFSIFAVSDVVVVQVFQRDLLAVVNAEGLHNRSCCI